MYYLFIYGVADIRKSQKYKRFPACKEFTVAQENQCIHKMKSRLGIHIYVCQTLYDSLGRSETPPLP